LQRFVIRTLGAKEIPFTIAHSASGVGGLHLAVAAGLGVTCLNASAVPDGAVVFTGATKLPALPEVEFTLVPPRAGELSVISEVRDMLAELFK
jgi:DNA-binding transcriptional LysR family regulator